VFDNKYRTEKKSSLNASTALFVPYQIFLYISSNKFSFRTNGEENKREKKSSRKKTLKVFYD